MVQRHEMTSCVNRSGLEIKFQKILGWACQEEKDPNVRKEIKEMQSI